MQTVYIVEDDKNISEIEFFALKNAGLEPVCFSEHDSFEKAVERRVPDLVLLDIMLPGSDGLAILKKLRSCEKTKNVAVIMVTAKSTELDKVRGFDSGADDYITKPFGLMELVSRVKAVLRRGANAIDNQSEIITFDSISINTQSRIVTADGSPLELTYKEFELLYLLVKNAGNVIPREILLEKIWNASSDVESRTVDMHIRTLRKKLKSAGDCIVTVRNVGYKMEKSN